MIKLNVLARSRHGLSRRSPLKAMSLPNLRSSPKSLAVRRQTSIIVPQALVSSTSLVAREGGSAGRGATHDAKLGTAAGYFEQGAETPGQSSSTGAH